MQDNCQTNLPVNLPVTFDLQYPVQGQQHMKGAGHVGPAIVSSIAWNSHGDDLAENSVRYVLAMRF